MFADEHSSPLQYGCYFVAKKQQDIARKPRRVSNGLLVRKSNLVDETQARTTLLRGIILEKYLTEENVGDCADFCRQKDNRTYEQALIKKMGDWYVPTATFVIS